MKVTTDSVEAVNVSEIKISIENGRTFVIDEVNQSLRIMVNDWFATITIESKNVITIKGDWA